MGGRTTVETLLFPSENPGRVQTHQNFASKKQRQKHYIMDVTRVKTSSGIVIVSVNCQSCGGPLKSTSGQCRCRYCGNTNLILENGKTRVLIGDYYVKGKNVNPEKKPESVLNFFIMIVLAACVVGFFAYGFHKRSKLINNQ